MPAASILKVLEKKELKDIDDTTLIKADIARKALAQVADTVVELMSERKYPLVRDSRRLTPR